MPDSTVIPELVYEDVGEAVTWLCEAFGFRERWRAGSHRAQLAVGQGAIAVTEQRTGTGWADQPDEVEFRPPRPGPVSQSVMVRVEDLDLHHDRARERGARVVHSPTDYPYGERQYEVEDLAGHRWTFSQTIADVAPEDWGGTAFRSEETAVVQAQPAPTLAHGKICHLELPAADPEAAAAFYERVFGWKVRRDGRALVFDDPTAEVSGHWVSHRAPAEPGLLFYVWVDDAAAVLERIIAEGSDLVQPIGGDPGEITARFRDPGGNVVGLYQEPQ